MLEIRKGDASMEARISLDSNFLEQFCEKWRIKELSLFGSALRENFGPESDLDFLVSFQEEATWDLFDLVSMKEELEKKFGRSVDLIEKEALRNPWRKFEIMRTREIVYAV